MFSSQDLLNEIRDNWRALVYIVLMIVSSICFHRERRAETRILRDMAKDFQQGIWIRLDRLETLVQERPSSTLDRTNQHPFSRYGSASDALTRSALAEWKESLTT